MTLDELNDEDLAILLAFKEVRRLRDDLRKERLTKTEILGRYEKVVSEKHSLETRVALLEAENKRLKTARPDPMRLIGTPPEPKSRLAELMQPVGSHESSFLGIP